MDETRRQLEQYGIVGMDACHNAAAVMGAAKEFYTFEKTTKPMFRTRSRSFPCYDLITQLINSMKHRKRRDEWLLMF